jgi:hypothetical protein
LVSPTRSAALSLRWAWKAQTRDTLRSAHDVVLVPPQKQTLDRGAKHPIHRLRLDDCETRRELVEVAENSDQCPGISVD